MATRIVTALEERAGGRVARVTLDNPAKLNCLDAAAILALTDALQALAADELLRAVVVTGAGPKAFCGGVNVEDLGATTQATAREGITRLYRCIRAASDSTGPGRSSAVLSISRSSNSGRRASSSASGPASVSMRSTIASRPGRWANRRNRLTALGRRESSVSQRASAWSGSGAVASASIRSGSNASNAARASTPRKLRIVSRQCAARSP